MRHEFLVDPNFINLNSGTQSLCPQSTLELVARLQREYETNPTFNMILAWQNLWKINLAMGRFFNADPGCFFLRSNVTQALNVLIFGFPLNAGDEILVSNLEYGAIANICRLRATRENLGYRQAAVPLRQNTDSDGPSAEILAQAILSQISPKTKMLVLSHVLTGTGQVLPLRAIAEETRRRGLFLIVDGAQAPGAISIDFSGLENVDAYAGNLHKWMMGPKGTGFGWVPRRHHSTLQTMGGGWNSFENFEPNKNYGDGSRFATEFLPQGCQDFSRYLALEDTFHFWEHHTPQKILKQLNHLQQVAWTHCRHALKLQPLSNEVKAFETGPLLCFELPEPFQKLQPAVLRDQIYKTTQVLVAIPMVEGRAVLRLSPHIYNTEDEITKGIDQLARLIH